MLRKRSPTSYCKWGLCPAFQGSLHSWSRLKHSLIYCRANADRRPTARGWHWPSPIRHTR
ncbi:hypothetical protein CT19425_U610029 [Cupriavidus taiwanensis]|uniref:Uncharacterized protein n=1 Tax=Cupriavidus taiwanensis TaxID=164546 RepID=A0A375I730_9BURK|nr:hypothetical protein CT19425_U610029 [Cupriavidus taiwanensis]